MTNKEKWIAPLSTTEPYNHIGLVQVRQNNKNSETWFVPIVQNGEEFNMTDDGITEVFFCTKFLGKYPVEQRATIVNAKKGHIKYTMSQPDMQVPGIQQAYFKFVDKNGQYQGSTQSFSYKIISSIESSCTESGTYIIRLEELFKLYQDFMNQQSKDWQAYVDANKEIIESIDPGGVLLNEIVRSRGDFDDLSKRLDFMEKNTNSKQNASDMTASLLTQTINSSLKLAVVENEVLKIFTRAVSKDSYVMFELKKGIGDTSDASYGNNFDLLRLTNVHSYKDIIVFNQPKTFSSSKLSNSDGDFRASSFLTGYTYPERMDYISNTNRESQGGYLEFDVTITKANKGFLDLGFYGTQNTNKNLGIYLNNKLIDTVDTTSTTPQTVFRSIPIGSFVGKGKLRLQLASDATASRAVHFLGYNAVDLKYLDSKNDINGYLANLNTGKHYISKTPGANDYALLKTSSKKWFGSFHGGEVLISRKILADGEEINLSVNRIVEANKVLIIQRTELIDLIESQTITDFSNDGTYVFQANFENKGNEIKVSDFYTCMTCSNNEFNDVIHPKMETANVLNNTINLERTGKVIQINPNTNQTITTEYIPQLKYYTNMPLRILYFDNLYSKVYHAQTINKDIILENLNFGNKKIFD